MLFTSSFFVKIPRNLLLALFSISFFLPSHSLFARASVIIGSQIWTVKNLDEGNFANGEAILNAKSDELNAGANQQPAWCYYKNKSEYGPKYGRLYNWYVVADSRGLCPAGWHVPDEE